MPNPAPAPPLRLLILGGTSEASGLVAALAGMRGLDPLLSLAGRTRVPAPSPVPTRTGGFGGADGLARFLADSDIGAVIDATHPFAARISAHAAEACARLQVPRAILTRAAWSAQAGDPWTPVPDLPAAAAALGATPRRVFLTTGRLGLAAFAAAPHHAYLVRTIDPPDPADLPPHADVVLARGPFPADDEAALMREHRIEVLVTKNSGGAASAGKLVAARRLGLPVIMVERPAAPSGPSLPDVDAAVRWVAAHVAASGA